MTIEYGNSASPFGLCFIALTDIGVCGLSFGSDDFLPFLRQKWSDYEFVENAQKIKFLADKIFIANETVKLHTRGTEFQQDVWETLQKIPFGTTVSYTELAELSGHKTAVRAVASAVASNDISYLIPCHRVVRKNGDIGQFRWGSDCKNKMLERELKRQHS